MAGVGGELGCCCQDDLLYFGLFVVGPLECLFLDEFDVLLRGDRGGFLNLGRAFERTQPLDVSIALGQSGFALFLCREVDGAGLGQADLRSHLCLAKRNDRSENQDAVNH